MMKSLSIKKLDCILILIALSVAAFFFVIQPEKGGCIAVIEQSGKKLSQFNLDSLNTTKRIDLGGPYQIVLQAESGKIRFSHSSCPDQTCVHTGFLDRPGQVAVCLPAQVSVRLEGSSLPFDGYTG